ncbi:hypothetical protein G3554_08105 [Micromonospora sp. PPF5-17]|uniref:SPW repeat-containing protein n=2 Tax=Micromonosporaceae TaxID=28056 RepID=A0ABX9WIE8_9ACTN|nr:hypothetical protein [Micromonospora sp. PPF5-17B]NES36131.1 hypothetical protein [Micromonospora solifontis]NES56688.1 hypothetical protein [Micromonospora sp. PPF5-6]RNL99886.1 hypothetical protein EFE23_08125 [Micromonospora solifontis]
MTLPAVPMSVAPEQQPAVPPERSSRALDVALRIAGGVVVVWAGVLAAVLELIFATGAWELVKGRPGGVSKAVVGISGAVGGAGGVVALTVLLGWFAYAAVGARWAVALAAVPWFVVIVAGGFRTTEGDLALTGDNVLGLALVVAGAVTFAVLGFRQLVAPPPVG